MFEEEFGARLRLLRKQAGFTQKALAKELHTSRGNISMYENGHRQPPYDLLIRMADFFMSIWTICWAGARTRPSNRI